MPQKAQKLSSKTALITGGSQGLGKEIATQFLHAGASVALCARNADTLKKTADELQALCVNGQKVWAFKADIGNEKDVDQLLHQLSVVAPNVDILINNAGIHGSIGSLENVDWEEWMGAIKVNLFGAIYLTRALIPKLKKQKSGKIIFISGGGATNPMPGMSAYAASKAAIVRMMETLAVELKVDGIDVNAIAPGALNTRLCNEVVEAGASAIGQVQHAKMIAVKENGGTPLCVPASLCVYLASEQSNGITGKLIIAPWDPWETLHTHHDDLDSDIYTLRRIIPKDRGKDWGDRK